MKTIKYSLMLLSVILILSGCTTQNTPNTQTAKIDINKEPLDDPKVLLMQIKQLDQEISASKEQIAELQEQISEQQQQIIEQQQVHANEEMYNLRNELDIIAHTFFSAIRFDEPDHLSDYLSKDTTIAGNELITVHPDNKMVYDLSWMKKMQNNLDTIRQRAYYLSDDSSSYTSIYEFKPRPDEHGEFQMGVLHVEFKKENDQWKVYHLYNDI